jgi:hypothetical protein
MEPEDETLYKAIEKHPEIKFKQALDRIQQLVLNHGFEF